MRLSRQFQACLFVVGLFYEYILSIKITSKRKTNDFQVLARIKKLSMLFSVCLILFCWLIFACEFEIFLLT